MWPLCLIPALGLLGALLIITLPREWGDWLTERLMRPPR
jgi:hypothetical protein